MWTIKNDDTGEILTIARDVTTEHPEWAHRQCGTSSEAAFQAMVDQMQPGDYDGDRDDFGIGWTDETE